MPLTVTRYVCFFVGVYDKKFMSSAPIFRVLGFFCGEILTTNNQNGKLCNDHG